MKRYLIAVLFTLNWVSAGPTVADTQQFIDYQYDGAGNIVSIRSSVNNGPPDVTLLVPEFVHKEKLTQIIAKGLNLERAIASENTDGLAIVNQNNLSATEHALTLFADQTAAIGPALLTFTTGLGSDTATVVIAERTPVISTDPNPILLQPDQQTKAVSLLFDKPFDSDQVFDVLIRDPSVAALAEQTVALPAGRQQAAINVTGLNTGSTTLEVNQLSNFLALAIPVIVAEPAPLPPGDLFVASKPLTVVFAHYQLPAGQNIVRSKPLKVVRQSFDLPPAGNFQSLSRPLRVVRASYDAPAGATSVLSPELGVILPPYVENMLPMQVFANSSETLVFNGVGLAAVTTVAFEPASGLSQSSPFTVNPDGTQLTVHLDVAAAAPAGLRRVVLSSPAGTMAFLAAGGDLLQIMQ